MPLVLHTCARLLPSFLTVVLVSAILNPFCCNRLPTIDSEPLQTETAFDNEDKRCPGKPDAVRSDAKVLPQQPWLLAPRWLPRVRAAGIGDVFRAGTSADCPAEPPLARHKLFSIYRV